MAKTKYPEGATLRAVSVRLTTDAVAGLRKKAELDGTTISEAVRKAVANTLMMMGKQQQSKTNNSH